MKYAALTLSSVATAVLVVGLVGIAQGIGSKGYSNLPLPMALSPLTEQQLKDQADVKESLQVLLHATQERRNTLGIMPAMPPSSMAYAVPGGPYDSIFSLPAPLEPEKPVLANQHTPLKAMPMPKISVVMGGGAEGKAIIDGHLRKVGDSVAKNLVVKAITLDTVTFSNGREDVLVAVPLERLRVLGAYPETQVKAK